MDDDSIRVRLLMVDTVRSDLGLTPDQVRKLTEYVKASQTLIREGLAKCREMFPPGKRFPSAEAETRLRELKALFQDLIDKTRELRRKALAMLTPDQSDRIKQIQLQNAIPAAMARPEIIKALDLSEEQRTRMRTLRDQMSQKALPPDFHGLNPKERRQKMSEFCKKSERSQAEATKRTLELLTPEQRAKFERLQGKKIDTARLDDELRKKAEEEAEESDFAEFG